MLDRLRRILRALGGRQCGYVDGGYITGRLPPDGEWIDLSEPPTIRFYGGPLDGEVDTVPHGCNPLRAAYGHSDTDEWDVYRADGTRDPDGAIRLYHDPQLEDL